jgi:hypothetical protein
MLKHKTFMTISTMHKEGSSQSYREKTAKSEETNAVEIGCQKKIER